jgi:hypothetical protein
MPAMVRLANALGLVIAVGLAGCGPKPGPQTVVDRGGDGSGSAVAVGADAGIAAADAGPPLPLDRDLPRLATRALAMYEAIAVAFREAGTDCSVATAKLVGIEAANADVIAANALVVRDGRSAELRLALKPQETRFGVAAAAVMGSPVLPACAHEPAFTAAFDGLAGSP